MENTKYPSTVPNLSGIFLLDRKSGMDSGWNGELSIGHMLEQIQNSKLCVPPGDSHLITLSANPKVCVDP